MEWRTIQHYGVEIHGQRYDGPGINDHRGTRSPYGGAHPGKWPFMLDRDDIRTVHFRDPTTKQWHRLEWEHAAQIDAPFSADAANYVRALGVTTHRHVDPQQAVQDLLTDWTAGEVATRRDRNLAIRLSTQRANAGGDTTDPADARDTASVPGVVDLLTRRRQQEEVLPDDLDDVFTRYYQQHAAAHHEPAAVMNPWARWLQANGPGRFQLASKAGWDAFVNTAAREPLSQLTRAEMARFSADELEDYTEARMVWNANLPTVRTHQLSSAFEVIDQVMASNRRDADRLRGSVVIDAAAELGKTTIATRYARDFHRRVYRRHGPKTAAGHQRLPVAFILLSAGITLKGLNQKILAFYGHPAANRASSARLGALAVDCVASCETQLVVIDDLHFIDFRHRNGQDVSNHLKGLANEMPVTFFYVGVRLREKRFFDEGILGPDAVYAQTSRRATRCQVALFDIGTDAGHRGWIDLLRALEGHILLAHARPGMLTDHAKELHRRTQGHIASLTNLVDRACYLAITTGAETITAELLAATSTDNAAQTPSRSG